MNLTAGLYGDGFVCKTRGIGIVLPELPKRISAARQKQKYKEAMNVPTSIGACISIAWFFLIRVSKSYVEKERHDLMKNKMRKVIAIISMAAVFISYFPTSVFAQGANLQNELREAIEGGEEMKALFPNGVFTFVGTRFNIGENTGTYEVKIARQGGTQGEVTVDFKAIDVSAKYGSDYVIEVPGFLWNKEIPGNPDSKPLLENAIQEETEIINNDDFGMTAEETQQQEGQPEQAEEEAQKTEKSQVAAEESQKSKSIVSGLRSASQILTGKTYDYPDWKELDMKPGEAEALKDNYQDYLDKTPGMETTLTFKDGEYVKSIFIKPIDDDLSESEEQFIIVLSNAAGGAEIGEFYTGWVNITDNEVFEDSAFEMETDKLIVEAGITQVSVKVRRTKGIHTMTYVTIGTAGITAGPDVDYVPTYKKILFLPDVTEQTFTVDLITAYSDEDKTFAIVIDDDRAAFGKNQTKITLTKDPGSHLLYQSKAETGSAYMGTFSQSTGLMSNYSVNSQSSVIEKITPNGKMDAEGRYIVMPDDFTLRYANNAAEPSNAGLYGMTVNPYAAKSSAGVGAPISLAGVKSFDVSWGNTGTAKNWYHHDDLDSECSDSCGWKTSNEFYSKFVINGPATSPWTQWDYNQYTVKKKQGGFSHEIENVPVKPWMWSSSSIEYWAWNGSDDIDNKLNANAVWLYLQPYALKIENDPAGTGVMARTVTGIDASGEPVGTGTPVNVGTMRIRGVSRDGGYGTGISKPYEKVVYRSDVITFEPVFNTDPSTNKSYADDAYLWGYKIRDRQGKWKYFEGNVLNLNSQWFRENAAAYQNETQGLYANALLRDDGKGNWSIEVRPVFKAKNERYIKLDIDSSKGSIDGFLDGTNSRVFAISRFDTLELKVLTKDNATIHNWYVTEDNSNIKVNSLENATTYFNNVNVGSSGNLPATGSFIANADKVTLDSSNVDPADKTELTYKPAARFTNIMPSFTDITAQEDPTSSTGDEETDPNRDKRVIYGNISISDKTYLNQNAVTATPLKGIEITVGSEGAITDSNGNFKIESSKFEAGKSYNCDFTYQGYKYAGHLMVGQNNIIIDLFKDPDIELTNMKLYETADNGGEELKPVNGYINLYDELDRNYDFVFDLSSGRLAGVEINEAIIVIRDKDGVLKSESLRIAKVTETPGRFEKRINPGSIPINMDVGDRIYIRPIDDNGAAYPEIATGIRVVRNPETINIQLGVDNNSDPVPNVSLFGQMSGKLVLLDVNAGNSRAITDQDKADIKSLTGSSGSNSGMNETERNLFAISLGSDNGMKANVNSSTPFLPLNVGIVLVYEAADDGNIYFNQLAIGGEAVTGRDVTLTYLTPIGIPVYASFSFSTGISANVALEPKDGNDLLLADVGTGWDGKVTGEDDINLTVGVGVELGFSADVLKLYLTGTAEADFAFTLVDSSTISSASFAASFGIRFFYFSKEWTIISKTWGASAKAMKAAQSGLYEPLSGFGKLSREYSNDISAWKTGGSDSGSVTERIVREDKAYPYPSNKLVNLPNGEILWVFVDDVPSRSVENGTAVYYSIISAEGSVSLPTMIDDDDTLDEAPDVLDLGNGEILITWSDASEKFDADDSEIYVLTHMDISAAFFNTATKTMSAPIKVTHTTGRIENISGTSYVVGDFCGDTSPRSAYDPETGRIILYYIKSDYYNGRSNARIEEGSIDESGSNVSDEDEQLVIGDIVNAFSMVAYRIAEKEGGKWVWKDGNSYTENEDAGISDRIAKEIEAGRLPSNYTTGDYKGHWYGQRFLDVGQRATITEVINITGGNETSNGDGYPYTAPVETTVVQEAAPLPKSFEPRVLDIAVASYDGLALIAYSTDEDKDLRTDKDQEIYLQIYDFSKKSFSHPIRLITDKVKINGIDRTYKYVKDSQPRFVRSNDITYLFWNRNGSIAYMDISGLIKYGLKEINLGTGFILNVIDKNNDDYARYEGSSKAEMKGIDISEGRWGEIRLAVDKGINPDPSEGNPATSDRAITSYDVVAGDGGDIYLIWTEYGTVLKDKKDAKRAADPENQVREKQIFIARWQSPGWSKPIQITTEQGANYDELGVAALEGNAGLKVAFIKYMQKLESVGGSSIKVFKQDLSNRALGLLTFRPATEVEFTDNSITFGKEKPQAGENVTVSALVKNTGIDAIRDARVEFYQIVDGEETLLDTKFNGTPLEGGTYPLVGGDEFNAQLLFRMPENNGDVSIKAVLKYVDSDGAEQSIVAQRSFAFEAVPEISDLRYEFIGIGKIVLDGTITNAGNKNDTLNVGISIVDNYGTEKTVDSVPVTLKQGESSHFSRELEIPGSYFTEMVPEAGQPTEGIKEMARIKVGVRDVKDEIAVVRSASARFLEVMNKVDDFNIGKNLTIRKGTTGKIEYNIAFKEATEGEKAALRDEMIIQYTSSDPNVVQVASDGTLYAISEGTATVQAVLMPATTLSVATKGSLTGEKAAPLAQQLTSSATLPDSVLRIENVAITVPSETSSSGGSSGGGSSSSGSRVDIIITPPAPDDPDSPIQAEIKVPVTVDSNNNVTVSITGQMVIDAFNKAQAEAEKNGYKQNGIALVLSVETRNEETGTITVNLPKAVQEAIISNKIASTIIVVDSPDIRISMDLETVKEINRQANSDVNVTAMKKDNSRLTEEARNAVGHRPVFDISVNFGSGSQIRNFGDGRVWVAIPYTLGENEKAENICAVYIDENGNVHWLTDSVYDSQKQALRFRTNHFSLYGVGYKEAATAFTDIEGHWAKEDIGFVVSRGLFNGTSKTTFSPNMAMSRGMFVTVLGRLAKADVSGYKESSFADVKSDAYYMSYIEWARSNNLVNGIGNGKFAPDESITREQMAVIMQKYAKAMGFTVPKVHEEMTFSDSDKISDYAREAVKLMQMAGILNGKSGNLFDPQGTATRAEVSAVLRRFVELMIPGGVM